MGLRSLIRASLPTKPWRLLRQGLRVLERIATALEEQNALMQQLHPDAAARLRTPDAPPTDSGVSYVDPDFVLRAESERMRVYEATGQMLDDDQLMAYLQIEDNLSNGARTD